MPVVLCFGDSNTWGWVPGADGARHPRAVRWPGVLAARLGDGWEVAEEGLNSRTTRHPMPDAPDREGLRWLPLALETHAPVDWLVLALGTNDLFGPAPARSAEAAAAGVAELVRVARDSPYGPRGGAPEVLVLTPPPMGPLLAEWRAKAPEAPAASHGFAPAYAAMGRRLGVPIVDLGALVAASPADGVHLDADAHAAIGRAVAGALVPAGTRA